ncbi:hypothetical protein ACVILK_002483 [Bradyrhizobium embrapense]
MSEGGNALSVMPALQWTACDETLPITFISSSRTMTWRPVSCAIFVATFIAVSALAHSSTMMLPFPAKASGFMTLTMAQL